MANNTEARDFLFTHQDFDRIRKLIYDHAGISLGPQKFDMVYSRLARRLRANRLTSFADYLAKLERNDPQEWEAFVNSLTTNLTAFFREEHHFSILADHLRPRMKNPPLTIWCAAASTGEEPYSLAMTVADLFGTLTPPVKILATDLDTNVLIKAQKAIYPLERVEKMPNDKLKRYFMRGTGPYEGTARVRKELCRLMTFRQINLLDNDWPIRGPLDAIFCRNVMIYFDKETQYQILQKFVPLLQPDGLLFAGHSESFNHASDLFKPLGKTVYEITHKDYSINPHAR
ncbi:MAG TPA: chemotaxis protein CheR [Betaproteobacteria bacterium]|nr:chemotaxis protein CheR [Betaproteobacteria bacterium]